MGIVRRLAEKVNTLKKKRWQMIYFAKIKVKVVAW
jgi:hypothetical protein